MPTLKKRINLTCDDEMVYLLEQYRDERFPFWSACGIGLSTVVCAILRDYLMTWKASRAE